MIYHDELVYHDELIDHDELVYHDDLVYDFVSFKLASLSIVHGGLAPFCGAGGHDAVALSRTGGV